MQTQAAGMQGTQQVELFAERVLEVFRRGAVIVVAAAGAAHTNHEVFVEAAAEPIGGRADAGLRHGSHAVGDFFRVRKAAVGAAVRQQQHAAECRALRALQGLADASMPAVVESRAAARVDGVHDVAELFGVRPDHLVRDVHRHLVVERDHGDAVRGLQRAEDHLHAAAGFAQRGAGHGTGAVDDERKVQRLALLVGGRRGRRLDAHQGVDGLGVAGEQGTALRLDADGERGRMGHGGDLLSGFPGAGLRRPAGPVKNVSDGVQCNDDIECCQ